jgi:hypothetical protein
LGINSRLGATKTATIVIITATNGVLLFIMYILEDLFIETLRANIP